MFVIKKVFYCSSDNVAFFPTREKALKFWYDHYSPGWSYEKYEQSYKENGVDEHDKYYLIFEAPMKAIAINEENHGLIGIAKDFPSAIDFLVADGWLNEYDKFWPLGEEDFKLKKVKDIFGEHWVKELKKLNEEDLCTFFDGSFYFQKFEVFGA